MDFERIVVDFYRHNLLLALPLTILAIKLIVRWLSREKTAEIFKGVLAMPLDFMYIAMSLVLAGLARRIPSFIAHYRSDTDADFNGAVLLILFILVAVLISIMDRGIRLLWQKSYAAWRLLGESEQPPMAAKTLARLFFYWSLMAPLAFGEVLLSLGSLGGIIRRI